MELRDASTFANQDSADYSEDISDTRRSKTSAVHVEPSDENIQIPAKDGAGADIFVPIVPTPFLQHFGIAVGKTADEVYKFMKSPWEATAEKQAVDTLSALGPFFWLLRGLGLCAAINLFNAPELGALRSKTERRWNITLSVYCAVIGIFLAGGFFATVGFSLAWPIAFCAGMSAMMEIDHQNTTYCRVDVMERFLTPKGMTTVVQSAFLFIGVSNMAISLLACRKLGPMFQLLRDYYAVTKAEIVKSHRKMAFVHAIGASAVVIAIGVPFTLVYENMTDEDLEMSYEGSCIEMSSAKKGQKILFDRYPFADIDTPLVKMENWIAYAGNSTATKNEKYVLNVLKITFRVQNFFMFMSCFAVPFFFSLMCSVLGKEWKRFIAYLQLETTRVALSTDSLRNLRKSHWLLCKIFYFLDDLFNPMILITYVMFIVINSSVIYIVLKFGTDANGRDRHAFYQAVIMFISLQIIFFLVIQRAMQVHLQAKEAIAAVRDWQPNLDDPIAQEYLLLVNQVQLAEISFTAGNCFRIEVAAYLNALAIIFSYVVMLLQFQPNDSTCKPHQERIRRTQLQ